MRKLISMLVLVAFVSAVAGLSMAQDAPKPDAPKDMTIKGIVVKVEDKVVNIASKNRNGDPVDRKITTDDKTVVTIDGKDAKVADLKAGLTVEVTQPRGRDVVATKIVATTIPTSAPAIPAPVVPKY